MTFYFFREGTLKYTTFTIIKCKSGFFDRNIPTISSTQGSTSKMFDTINKTLNNNYVCHKHTKSLYIGIYEGHHRNYMKNGRQCK